MAIDRTAYNAIVESDGSPGHGTVWGKTVIAAALLDPIDAEIASVVGAGLTDGSNYINDTSNAQMTVGITINQGGADDQIIALKSSDVDHGITSQVETDTYGFVKKISPTGGGVRLRGFCGAANDKALAFDAFVETTVATRSTAAEAPIDLNVAVKSGTTVGTVSANQNLVVIRNHESARFIFDSDGDSHQDVGTAWTNFDSEDDVEVLHLLAAHVSRPDDPLHSTFLAWLVKSRATLERLRLVTFNADGHHFVNMSRLTMLLVGQARQQSRRLDRLESRLLALEA